MANDVIQFVDKIDAAPTVRLDLNNENPWACKKFSAPPPRLRRAVSQNMMRDGVNVGSDLYDGRVLTLELELRTTTQDLNATALQNLARELDRATNFIKYQPNGATKPVFFKTFRSDIADIENIIVQAAFRKPTIEILAEPFALGLKEILGPFTVNNDPAAANGHFVDVTGVIGDVDVPCVVINATRSAGGIVALRQHGTPSDMAWWVQAESLTLGTDTTNPGGGPDAVMSGAGANNYVRTTFATNANMVTRLTWDIALTATTAAQRRAMMGTFRLFAVVRRTNSTADFRIKAGFTGAPTVILEANTLDRQLVDLGLVRPIPDIPKVGYTTTDNQPIPYQFSIDAQRASGAGSLDWDYLMLVPADTAMLTWTDSASTARDQIIDNISEMVSYFTSGGDPFAGTAEFSQGIRPAAGGFFNLVPNQTNRVFFLESNHTFVGRDGVITKANTNALTFHYWPRYLHIRPSAT